MQRGGTMGYEAGLVQEAGRSDAVAEFETRYSDFRKRQRLYTLLILAALGALLAWSFSVSEVFGANRGSDPLARMAVFLDKLLPDLEPRHLLGGVEQPGSLENWFYGWPLWLSALWETLQMAIVSSVIGGILAVPVGILSSRNLMPFASVRFTVRRILEAIRTLPDIIVALILVAAFGVGPLAGVITIVLSTVGRLGKLYAEINENADMGQLKGIEASGGNWWHALRYGLMPQVAPGYASYALLKFEGNIGAAAALGIVGAGGIGIELSRAITYTLFADYLAILLMITVLIFVIDMMSEAVRHRLIGVQSGYV